MDPEANMDAQECLRIKRLEQGPLTAAEQQELDSLVSALHEWRAHGGFPGAWWCYPLTARALGYACPR